MTIRSNRLARALLRIFQLVRILAIFGLVILIPTMVFAFLFPGIHPGASVKLNGVPVTHAEPLLAGTLLTFANALLAAALVILTKLIGMMRSVVAGNPFVLDNVARLRVIAATMGAMVIFQLVAGLAMTPTARAFYDIRSPHFDFGLFLGMLTVLVLAEVFREGVALREDAEGTI